MISKLYMHINIIYIYIFNMSTSKYHITSTPISGGGKEYPAEMSVKNGGGEEFASSFQLFKQTLKEMHKLFAYG